MFRKVMYSLLLLLLLTTIFRLQQKDRAFINYIQNNSVILNSWYAHFVIIMIQVYLDANRRRRKFRTNAEVILDSSIVTKTKVSQSIFSRMIMPNDWFCSWIIIPRRRSGTLRWIKHNTSMGLHTISLQLTIL